MSNCHFSNPSKWATRTRLTKEKNNRYCYGSYQKKGRLRKIIPSPLNVILIPRNQHLENQNKKNSRRNSILKISFCLSNLTKKKSTIKIPNIDKLQFASAIRSPFTTPSTVVLSCMHNIWNIKIHSKWATRMRFTRTAEEKKENEQKKKIGKIVAKWQREVAAISSCISFFPTART